jgi:hypothetical protein
VLPWARVSCQVVCRARHTVHGVPCMAQTRSHSTCTKLRCVDVSRELCIALRGGLLLQSMHAPAHRAGRTGSRKQIDLVMEKLRG